MNRRRFLESIAAGGVALQAPFIFAQASERRLRTALIGSGWWGRNILQEATRGTLHIGWRDGWTFYPANESDKLVHEDAQLQEPDGHNLKLLWADFLDAIVEKRPPTAGIDTAHRCSVLPLLGILSWKLGRSIEWDGAKEQIVSDPGANRLLSRAYRAPWQYPEV
jgi:hypothetical protein